ncbi:nucleophile aminohydrolase [Xylaria palmicola]|nr:nucleophile aminohydrolase [Xylaria palmicola]
MSDPSLQQAPPGEPEQTTGMPGHQPPPLRTYYEQVRSLLGKRSLDGDGIAPAETPDSAGPSRSGVPDPYDSNDLDDGNGLSRFTKKAKRDIFTVDGTIDKVNKRWGKPVAAIFIHAGAGYHSTANEEHHLKACSEAARASMRALKGGRSAIEAVETAIKSLEDKEITNAGYGSNLSIDGTVECDATVVDHLGRSGACGAVSNVKNPITLARNILESSNKPLSLRRVPPNLLVGDGARDFAKESGIELVTNDELVSKNARDRFFRWREDLRRAESRESPVSCSSRGETPPQSDQDNRREHTRAILTGTWNEGQPDSPASDSPWVSPQNARSPLSPPSNVAGMSQASPKSGQERNPLSFLGTSLLHKRQRLQPAHSDDYTDDHAAHSIPTVELSRNQPSTPKSSYIAPHDGANDERDTMAFEDPMRPPRPQLSCRASNSTYAIARDEDRITDTVGAIAIDHSGRIAAGSSSGGIGMKHRGRIGPAALVGVGTALIPADELDVDGITVATVMSGTGEHMATTMASQRCAERIQQGSVRGPGGQDVLSDDENAVLASFIANDFLGHPGVRGSTSPAAIGTMAVKKAPGGYYLYFAHNTESFALASMGSNDASPACVMSRIHEGGSSVAQGARKIRT